MHACLFIQCMCTTWVKCVCVFAAHTSDCICSPGMNLQEDDEDGEFRSSRPTGTPVGLDAVPGCRSKKQSAIAENIINYHQLLGAYVYRLALALALADIDHKLL